MVHDMGMKNEYDDLYVRATWLIDNRYSDKPLEELINDLRDAETSKIPNTKQEYQQ